MHHASQDVILEGRKEFEMVSMDTLTIKTENKFRSLVTKQAYKKGQVICEIPTEKVINKANRLCTATRLAKKS